MACTGRKWCDFVSFDPRMPENLQLFVKRIEFEAQYVKMLELEITEFLEEVNQKVITLRNLNV